MLRRVRMAALVVIGAGLLISSAPVIEGAPSPGAADLAGALGLADDKGYLHSLPVHVKIPPSPSPAPILPKPRPIPVAPPPRPETPAGHISIPAIGLTYVAIFDRGTDRNQEMLIAPGYSLTHFTGAGGLGSSGNAVLYGHDDVSGGVFRSLDSLHDGDGISMLVGDKTFNYRVSGPPAHVSPNDQSILNVGGRPRLTLFSCWPQFKDDQRVVVTAHPT